jgi:hypothetical protein
LPGARNCTRPAAPATQESCQAARAIFVPDLRRARSRQAEERPFIGQISARYRGLLPI